MAVYFSSSSHECNYCSVQKLPLMSDFPFSNPPWFVVKLLEDDLVVIPSWILQCHPQFTGLKMTVPFQCVADM